MGQRNEYSNAQRDDEMTAGNVCREVQGKVLSFVNCETGRYPNEPP